MSEDLLISVKILAADYASRVLAALSTNAMGEFGLIERAAIGVGGAIAAIGATSLILATQFDQSMHRISALTDTSAAQMDYYKQKILELAPALDQSPKALADGLYFVISAGYEGAQAMDILTQSAKASAATFTPMKDVADLLTTAMNAYKGSALSAGHAMDDITKVVVNGKVTMSSLATSFGFVGVTAHAAGLSFDEASAAVSALSQTAGEHGSRRVMMDLDNLLRSVGIDIETTAKRAKKLGLSFDEGKFAAMPFIEKLQYLAQISGGVGYNLDSARLKADLASGNMEDLALQTAKANSKFKELVGGAAAFLPAAMLLSDKGATYAGILKQMGGNGEATARAFDDMRKSTGQQWNMFQKTLETIATVIGLQLLPYANQLLTAFTQAGRGLIAFLQNKDDLDKAKWALLGIAIVIGVVLAPAIGAATVAALPWIAAVAGIVAGGALLGFILKSVVDRLGGMQAIMRSLHPVIVFIQQAVQRAGDELNRAFNREDVKSALSDLSSMLLQLKPVLEIVGFIVGVVLVLAFNQIVAVLRGVATALPAIIDLVAGFFALFGAEAQTIIDLFTGKWDKLPADMEQIWGAIKLIVINALDALSGLFGGFFEHWLELLGTNGDKVKAKFSGILGDLLDSLHIHNDLSQTARDQAHAQELLQQQKQHAELLVEDAQYWTNRRAVAEKHLAETTDPAKRATLRHEIGNADAHIASDHREMAQSQQQVQQIVAHHAKVAAQNKTFLDGIGAAIGGFFNGLGTTVHNSLKGIEKWFEDTWENIKKSVGGFFDGLGTAVHNGLKSAQRLVGTFFEQVKRDFETGLEKARQTVLTFLGNVGNIFGWLYNHNTYVKRLVDTVHQHLLDLRNRAEKAIGDFRHSILKHFTQAHHDATQKAQQTRDTVHQHLLDLRKRAEDAIASLRGALLAKWAEIKEHARQAGEWLFIHVVKPAEDLKVRVDKAIADLKSALTQRWEQIKRSAEDAWQRLKDAVGAVLSGWWNAIYNQHIKPIIDWADGLGTTLYDKAKSAFESFVDGVGDGLRNIGTVIHNVIGGALAFLGFHDLPGFAAGGIAPGGLAIVGERGPELAWLPTGTRITPNNAIGSTLGGVLTGNGVGSGSGSGGGGGGATMHTHYHNWAGAFPNAVNRAEIEAAIRSVQQQDYRLSRRAGGYAGVRTGI